MDVSDVDEEVDAVKVAEVATAAWAMCAMWGGGYAVAGGARPLLSGGWRRRGDARGRNDAA